LRGADDGGAGVLNGVLPSDLGVLLFLEAFFVKGDQADLADFLVDATKAIFCT
jgi:hypothetical protein